jgi:hypothetical protein
MGFFDALRRSLGGESPPNYTSREIEARLLGVDPDTLPIAEETPFESGVYDGCDRTHSKDYAAFLGHLVPKRS